MLDLIASALSFDSSPRATTGWASNPPLDDYWYYPRGGMASSGIEVTEELAMTNNTVYACVAKIAKTIGTLTQDVYERLPDGGKRPIPDHDIYHILHDVPNDEMDAVSYEESSMANLLLRGMRYSEIVRHRSSKRVEQLWPLEHHTIKQTRDKQGRIVYEYRPNGVLETTYPADRILCVPGLSFNGLTGLTPIGVQRESVGLGLVTAKFGAKLFQNGAVLRGYIKSPKRLGPTAYARLKESFNDEHGGWEKAHGTLVLEEDTEYHPMGISPEDAQFLGTRAFQALEICAMFDTPPHKIGILDHATFSNIEEQQIQWVVDTIGPWCRRLEAAKNRQLLGDERGRFVLYNTEGLLRGDTERRHNALAQGRQWGWLSTNDVRRIENMNPVEGGDDDRLTPLNMRVGDEPRPATGGGASRGGEEDRRPSAMLPVIEDVARRMVTKETKAIENALKRTAKAGNAVGFLEWLDAFYNKHEQDTVSALVSVAAAVVGESGAPAIAERAARKYATVSLAAMRDCAMNAPQRIPQELNAWLYGKPSKIETLAAEWSQCLQ